MPFFYMTEPHSAGPEKPERENIFSEMMNFSIKNFIDTLPGTKRIFHFALIALLILIVYYPAFFAGWCRVDDIEIMNRLRNIGIKNLDLIFIPGFKEGVYYRPLIKFSFWLDNYLWNFNVFWMHAENVGLHFFNAILVYLLASQLTKIAGRLNNSVPFLAAVLFGLHPVNSESVNWIAGRSDILAGSFILLSANALLKARESGSRCWLLMAGFVILPGFLTKEVAIAFLPGAFALVLVPHLDQGTQTSSADESPRNSNRELRFLILAGLIALALFFLLRSFGIQKTEFRVGHAVNRMIGDPPATLLVFLQAFGFYLKKLLVPVPLNFAILEVDPLYFFLGLPAVVLLFVILRWQPMHGAFLVTGFFMLSPAFIIAMGKFAWTSYAERYLYVPSAFIIPVIVHLATEAISRMSRRGLSNPLRLAAAMCMLLFAAVSLHRSIVWMHDETLLADTIEKSPQVMSLRIDYAILLADQGNLDAARQQLTVVREKTQARIERILSQMHNKSIDSTADLLLAEAYLLEREGKAYDAFRKYEEAMEYPTKWSSPAIARASMLANTMISRSEPPAKKTELKKKLKKFSEMPSNTLDPHLLYLVGKTFWIQKDFASSRYYFELARDRFDKYDVYRHFSEKMLRNLRAEA